MGAPKVLNPLDFDGFDKAVLESETKTFHLIGFSLGAMTALKIAAMRPENVNRVTLIAPAAPLELGEFLPNMAGRAVFNMAAKGSILFRLFTGIQRLGVRIFPKAIIKTMFAGSPQADMALLGKPVFNAALLRGLKASFGPHRQSYRKAVLTYVQPWADDLKNIKCPVNIHHGTDDNWAPIEMAYALGREIKTEVNIIEYKELGHYATLYKALPVCF